MGYGMHIRTQSHISYSDASYFNWCSGSVRDFLREHCESFYSNEENTEWEVNRQDLRKLVGKIKRLVKTDPDGICLCYYDVKYTNTEVLSILLDILRATKNKRNFDCPDIIYLDWF